jgi:hypothetical protein
VRHRANLLGFSGIVAIHIYSRLLIFEVAMTDAADATRIIYVFEALKFEWKIRDFPRKAPKKHLIKAFNHLHIVAKTPAIIIARKVLLAKLRLELDNIAHNKPCDFLLIQDTHLVDNGSGVARKDDPLFS